MARYNAIYAGPFTDPTPQVREALASVEIAPGSLVVANASGQFALADATTEGKMYVAQDNYLTGKGIDTAWAADSTAIGMEMLPGQLFYVMVAAGQDLAEGDALTSGANGRAQAAATGDYVFATAHEAYNNNTGSPQLVAVRAAVGYVAT